MAESTPDGLTPEDLEDIMRLIEEFAQEEGDPQLVERMRKAFQRGYEGPPLTPEEAENEGRKLLAAIAHRADIVFARLSLTDVVEEWVKRMTRK